MKFILLLLIFIMSFLIVSIVTIKLQLKNYKNKSNSLIQTKEIKFKNFISKINFIKTKEIFLSKQGYPLKLDVIRYYSVKIFLSFIFFIAGIFNYHSFFYAIVFSIASWFVLDIYLRINKKSRDTEVCNDLLNVINSISLQLSAHIPLKDSLKKQYENCKNKDLKQAMIAFSTMYELSELNIDLAITKLKEKFDIMEMDMFCNTLSESNKSESTLEMLENLAESLSGRQIEKIKQVTRNKVLYITFGVIIALANIILLTFYPLFISVGQGFNNIFK